MDSVNKQITSDSNKRTELTLTKGQEKIVRQALTILCSTMRENPVEMTDPNTVRRYLKLQLANRLREVFVCLYLDNQHRLIKYRELFFGTIDGASVHPRVVAHDAFRYNAAAVIFAHNHPSGVAEPSQADRRITGRLIQALMLIDVRVLDHLVVSEQAIVSFSERGLL